MYPPLLDVNMIAVLNGMERMEEHWTNLPRQAGLEVVKLWSHGPEWEGLVQTMLPTGLFQLVDFL